MKFDDITDLCIYNRNKDIVKDQNFIITNYNYKDLENIDIDKFYKFDRVVNDILVRNLRFCIFVDEFSNDAIDKLASRLEIVNKKALEHFKYNMDLRYFTKDFNVKVSKHSSNDAYYYFANSLFEYYEIRSNFNTIKNCLILIETKVKFDNFTKNQQVLIKYFKDSNVEELLIILTFYNCDLTELVHFKESMKNKYIYTESSRKIIIKVYEKIFFFNEVSNGIQMENIK
jgi:hypothetical protein